MALHELAAPKSFGRTPSCRKHLERTPNGIEAMERSPDKAEYTDATISFAWGKTCGVYII